MEIEAVNTLSTAAATAPAADIATQAPSNQDVEAFTRVLFGLTEQTPEATAADGLRALSVQTETAFRDARNASELVKDPRALLIAQSTLLHSIVQVDFVAKAAGSLSQSINKLTSMQ